MPVARYTLALSWSPEYCRTRKNSTVDARQCSGKSGRFGLILHGLWPEGAGKGWPQYCPATARLSSAEAKRNLCITPSAALLAHEWVKHGSCMARTPETYFARARQMWNGLQLPDMDHISRKRGLTVADIRSAIADANPQLPRNSVGVVLNSRGWLSEIRLCYDRRFRPEPCDVRRMGAADSQAAKIWRGL